MPATSQIQRPTLRESLAWTLALSTLWLIVYGACNHITSLRHDVRVVQFAWERHIPLIPWLIVPYMSIDLFFVAAPFLCRSRRELHILAARLIAATLTAAYFFLSIPMRLADDRPTFEGAAGAIHNILKSGDKPFNLFPSLHVALLLLLWPLYHRTTRGPLRLAIHAWFTLIFLSVLPVYQHHAIDVAGGIILAAICTIAFPLTNAHEFAPGTARRRTTLALRFALPGIILAAIGIFLGPWSVLPGWIALALLLTACAYWFNGPATLAKSNGRRAWTSRALLAPYLLGLNATRRYWHSRGAATRSRIGDHLLIGGYLRDTDRESLATENIIAILDLTAEHDRPNSLAHLPYLNLQVLDLTPPTPAQCREAVSFINHHTPRGRVYIHCGLGYSRSATIAAAYLLSNCLVPDVESACAAITAARPGAKLGPKELQLLENFRPRT